MAYIPYPFFHDDMPIDISFAFGDEAPAGKHGFVRVEGDGMVFTDGTPARFFGVNLVRFHQLDAEWDSPHIFAFGKGPRIGNTLTLHPESMARLDYLVAPLTLDGMTVNCTTDFAVIACSSLTDATIADSDNLLLTAVGRARNTDMRFADEILVDYGRPPVEIEVIEAEISLAATNPNMKVWAVNAEGMFTGFLDSRWQDGILTFRIGETMRSMYYLIQAE